MLPITHAEWAGDLVGRQALRPVSMIIGNPAKPPVSERGEESLPQAAGYTKCACGWSGSWSGSWSTNWSQVGQYQRTSMGVPQAG
jgi:hypothetical protein